jgi:HNH endonuclease
MITVWKIAPGPRAWNWEECRKRKCITINWLNETDLKTFHNKHEITRVLLRAKDGKARSANSIWLFVREMRQGDVVVANDGLSRVVGIGLVNSGYLPPNDARNPNGDLEYHRQARLVDWVVDEAVDLPRKLFVQDTVQRLTPQQCRLISRSYVAQYPKLKATVGSVFASRLPPNRFGPAADESESDDKSAYIAFDGDDRELAWQQIKKRRGQPQFREALLSRYARRCLITGCRILDVLEAAHIDPYRGEDTNHAANGLLLRADIHTLFDLDLLGIEPNRLRVEVHPDIAEEYGSLVGKTLDCSVGYGPSQNALKRRYRRFARRKMWSA